MTATSWRPATVAEDSGLRWLILLGIFISLWFTTPLDPFYTVGMDEIGGADTGALEGGGILRQLGILMLGGLGVLMLFSARQRFAINGLLPVMVIAFLTWAALSLYWIDDFGLGVRRIAVLFLLYLGAFGMAMRLSLRDIMIFSLAAGFAIAAASLAVEIALGTFLVSGERAYRFAGLLNPNNQGMSLAIAILAAVYLWRSAPELRPLLVPALMFLIILLVMTKSRGAAASAFLGWAVVWIATSNGQQKVLSIPVALMLSPLVILVLADAAATQSAIGMGRENTQPETLTGRVPLWEILLTYVEERPWFGTGWGGFWTGPNIQRVTLLADWDIYSAHSGWMHLLLEVGIIGTALFAAVLVLACGYALVRAMGTDGEDVRFAAAILITILANMFVETTMHNTNLLNLVAVALILHLAFVARDKKDNPHHA